MNRSIDSFNTFEISVPADQGRGRGLGILRGFTIISAIAGQLIFIFSTIYYLALHQDYRNEEIDQMCTNIRQRIDNLEFCEFLTNWRLCSVLGIVVGSLQILISVASASFKKVETKTNVWCAAHACFLVVLLPVFILSLSSHNRVGSSPIDGQEMPTIAKKQLLFIIIAAVDLIFSLVSIVAIPLTYGLEVQINYSVLVNLE